MEPIAERMLVVIGATPEGKKELVGFQVGTRESAQSWRELLVDLKARGLAVAPELAVGDGALGFWKALDDVFPSTRHQRCWVHKVVNVLNAVPNSMALQVKRDLNEIVAELLGGTNCGRGNRWDVLAQIILPSSLDWGGRYLPANGPSTLIVHPDMNRAC